MTYKDRDWIKAITSLLKLTSEGKIVWKSSAMPDDFLREGTYSINRIYQATWRDKLYKIFDVVIQEEYDDGIYNKIEFILDIFSMKEDVLTRIARSKPLGALGDLFIVIENREAYNNSALSDLLDDVE